MVGGPRADPNARNVLNSFIKKLDDVLKESSYLTGDKLTSADISVWSLLAPDGTLKGAQNIDNITKWYRKIAELAEVKAALEILPIKTLHFASLVQSNKFGGLFHIGLVPHVGDEELNLLADSPSNVADTVLQEEINLAKECFVFEKEIKKDEPRVM